MKMMSPAALKSEQKYIKGVLAIYGGPKGELAAMTRGIRAEEVEARHVKLFLHMAEYKLQKHFTKTNAGKLRSIRAKTERIRLKIEESYANEEMSIKDFITEFNSLTIDFQNQLANSLKPNYYEQLLDLKPGDTIILADREIVKKEYNVEF